MKRLITLAALLVVLGGVVGAYFIIKNRPPKQPDVTEEDTGKVQIDRFDVEKVRKIQLVSDERTLTLVKEEGAWKLDVPYDVELDQTKLEDVAYSFSSMYSESIVEENPADLSAYGLDKPRQVATAWLDDGSTRTYYLGDRTPTGNTYYLLPKDSTTVYSVWMNHGINFSSTATDLRYKKMPVVDTQNVTYVYLKRRDRPALEMQLPPQDMQKSLYVFGGWMVSRPYRQPRGVDSEELQSLLDGLYFTEVKGFVEDNVRDLTRYGLEPPEGEILIRDQTTTLHLYVGKHLDEYTTYFRYPNSRNVYTVDRSRVALLDYTPFEFVDKFAFIVNVDWVDRVTITHRDGRVYTVDIKRQGKDEYDNWISSFWINGKEIEDEPFRKFYQRVIGVLLDGEASREVSGSPVVSFVFDVAADTASGRKAQTVKLEYMDYSSDFYLVRRDGVGEFVTAKKRDVERALAEAEQLLK